MAPIRVGLIGLDATEPKLGPRAWGVAAHLSSLINLPQYDLVAVCNSSIESAQRAIDYHKLPSTTKAYGSASDLAADPDVDLVVVSVKVEKHQQLALPALQAKKQVFVEWPLGSTPAQAEEMGKIAKNSDLKTIVGLQWRLDPMLVKAKQLVENGKIGRVMSTLAWINSAWMAPDIWADDATFYLEFKTGGNEYHISAGHILDGFTHVVGDFARTHSIMKTQWPTIKLMNMATGGVTNPSFHKKVPDHFVISGELESGALASITLRKTFPAIDEHVVRWIISGTEGEIEMTVDGFGVQMGNEKRTLKIKAQGMDNVEEINWADNGENKHIGDVYPIGSNTARVYDDFAEGKQNHATFADAVKMHKLLEKLAKDSGYEQ